MRTRSMPVLALCLCLSASISGCRVDDGVPAGAQIVCGSDGDCPARMVCFANLNRCVAEGTEPAEPKVAFISPADGEARVSVQPTIVVAFTVPVSRESVVERAHLLDAAGMQQPIDLQPADVPGTVAFVSRNQLPDRKPFTFVVDEGVEPAPGQLAVASKARFSSSFVTGEAPDRDPPKPPTDFVVDRVADDRAELTWKNPTDGDFAGVLVVRRKGGPVPADVAPQIGVTYAAGEKLGGADIVAVTRTGAFSDVGLEPDTYSYAAFALDRASNYSPAAIPPFVSAVSVRWCPDGTGTFEVDSADATATEALDFIPAVAPEFLYPAEPRPKAGTVAPLTPGGGLQLGEGYDVRGRADNAMGRTVERAGHLVLSDKSLLPLRQPSDVAVAAYASMGFNDTGWSDYEGEVDLDPAAGQETWSATGVTVEPAQSRTGANVNAKMPNAGYFRFRRRPKVSGCADADWTTSAEFKVGNPG